MDRHSGNNILMLKIEKGTNEDINKLIKFCPELINSFNKSGNGALYTAIKMKNLDIVQKILDSGGNQNQINKAGQNPFYTAVFYNSLPIAKILQQYNSDIDQPDKRGWTPLFIACHYGYIEIIEFLLSHNVNLKHKNNQKQNIFDISKDKSVLETIFQKSGLQHQQLNSILPFPTYTKILYKNQQQQQQLSSSSKKHGSSKSNKIQYEKLIQKQQNEKKNLLNSLDKDEKQNSKQTSPEKQQQQLINLYSNNTSPYNLSNSDINNNDKSLDNQQYDNLKVNIINMIQSPTKPSNLNNNYNIENNNCNIENNNYNIQNIDLQGKLETLQIKQLEKQQIQKKYDSLQISPPSDEEKLNSINQIQNNKVSITKNQVYAQPLKEINYQTNELQQQIQIDTARFNEYKNQESIKQQNNKIQKNIVIKDYIQQENQNSQQNENFKNQMVQQYKEIINTQKQKVEEIIKNDQCKNQILDQYRNLENSLNQIFGKFQFYHNKESQSELEEGFFKLFVDLLHLLVEQTQQIYKNQQEIPNSEIDCANNNNKTNSSPYSKIKQKLFKNDEQQQSNININIDNQNIQNIQQNCWDNCSRSLECLNRLSQQREATIKTLLAQKNIQIERFQKQQFHENIKQQIQSTLFEIQQAQNLITYKQLKNSEQNSDLHFNKEDKTEQNSQDNTNNKLYQELSLNDNPFLTQSNVQQRIQRLNETLNFRLKISRMIQQ